MSNLQLFLVMTFLGVVIGFSGAPFAARATVAAGTVLKADRLPAGAARFAPGATVEVRTAPGVSELRRVPADR